MKSARSMDATSRKRAAVVWAMAALALASSGGATAAAIGLPDNTARLGYAVGLSRLVLDDPAGSTKAALAVQPVTLIYTDWSPGGLRYWAEAYYARATLDADTTHVGQDASRLGVRLALQRNVSLGPWRPWIGLGVDVSRNRYSRRHTEDGDGFLLNAYADRSNTALGLSLHVVQEWAVARNWDLIGKAEQLVSVTGGVGETALSVGVLYRY